MPVAELLARTSSHELTEWMAYERVTGPLDSRYRTDLAASVVASTVANSQGNKLKPQDFMPVWYKRKRTAREIWESVMKSNAAFGGTYR